MYSLAILFMVSDIAKWYLVSPILSLVLCVGWFVSRFANRALLTWLIVGLALLGLQSNFKRYQQAVDGLASYQAVERFADWANRNLPSDAVIAVCDAGEISHVLNVRVMNADGLVNDWRYFDAYRQGNALQELKFRGATHLMTVFGHQIRSLSPDSQMTYCLRSPMGIFEANTDTFNLSDIVHAEPYSSELLGGARSTMVMWKFD
ncbi:hypothetical protein IT157_10930 [bacterium]|nr:hypothetical protein [bacterium]